ncbi:MAG: DNA replication/repair protein RecF [Flavobacteriaceae bacterium]|nr:DNA replication/repair protein RecF [Flavobacteriaceae bacterium]
MYLQELTLVNFKNFEQQSFSFDCKINCFTGNNGVGKTNILDAIHHLSYTKSYFNPIASQSIRHEQDFFMVEGNFLIDNEVNTVTCSLKKGHKKVIKKNGKAYEKFSEHIGLLPLVIISPADRDLIIEGSSIRRKFIDEVISQSNKTYLQQLINYQKVLSQRNSLLKYFAVNHTFDELNISVYNEQLQQFGVEIFEQRKEFLKELIPVFQQRYQEISNQKEEVSIDYKSHLENNNLKVLLEESIKKDLLVQYTTCGVHKDDLVFTINGYPVKKFGSQGQQKSFLIALKLAQFDVIQQRIKTPPLLLLDDIFDKLDDSRVAQLIQLVNQHEFGQIFITDTHKERTEEIVKQTQQNYEIFEIK